MSIKKEQTLNLLYKTLIIYEMGQLDDMDRTT